MEPDPAPEQAASAPEQAAPKANVAPSFSVEPGLLPNEVAQLDAQKLDPAEYVALVAPVVALQFAVGTAPAGGAVPAGSKVLVLGAEVHVPYDAVPIPMSGLMDANGQAFAARKVKEALPGVPLVRLLVKRSALGDDVRHGLDVYEARMREQAAVMRTGGVGGMLARLGIEQPVGDEPREGGGE